LSETSVLALAPVCERCKTVITKIGGTLGMTSAYGVNDPSITRKRVEADLAVFSEYRAKYVGMREACKEELTWGLERYAKLPPTPELLGVEPSPQVGGIVTYVGTALLFSMQAALSFVVLGPFVALISCPFMAKRPGMLDRWWGEGFMSGMLKFARYWVAVCLAVPLGLLVFNLVVFVFQSIRTRIVNGTRPQENRQRRRDYQLAYANALKAAQPVKAAQDHRLSFRIRELDGLIATVTEKEEAIRNILRNPLDKPAATLDMSGDGLDGQPVTCPNCGKTSLFGRFGVNSANKGRCPHCSVHVDFE